ncbi:undecaprenyldiphospho-muramoylpentapeptide beta-N-acetylglucosaminyltransferase [Paenibacillus donghaensis]|uniref:undecaprenyldiphospho-muramoylpentapeptide beta-N-acetylglucosaminyltransferase n=1 Tax=Paenibacillus donghaensis TaxID=414771 RepID=UPI0026992D7D
MKKILLTGGGSTGHVAVNLALIPKLRNLNWEIGYIGSKNGIEHELINGIKDVKYFAISTGKLRRYISIENLKDPVKVIKGIRQSYKIIREYKPDVIFSKGGFVSVPVVLAAWMNKVPIIIHESDVTPGLANKISMPFASKICLTFKDTERLVPKEKGIFVGPIIRNDIKNGSKERAMEMCGFHDRRAVLLVMGGSLGSNFINQVVRDSVPRLMSKFQIIHICGKDNVESSFNVDGYKQFEYVDSELKHLLALADIVVSRAGSNSIFEFLYLNKPMLLVPLSGKASRGDQILNANSFQQLGYSRVMTEEKCNMGTFIEEVNFLYTNREPIIDKMKQAPKKDTLEDIINIINDFTRSR